MFEEIDPFTTDLLASSISEAMEVMAFLTPMPAETTSPPDGLLVATRLDYRGAACGWLELYCSPQLGSTLLANLLGGESEVTTSKEHALDALRELVNVTCGTLLRQAGLTERGIIEMSVPSQRLMDEQEWSSIVAKGARMLDAEGCLLAATHTRLAA